MKTQPFSNLELLEYFLTEASHAGCRGDASEEKKWLDKWKNLLLTGSVNTTTTWDA